MRRVLVKEKTEVEVEASKTAKKMINLEVTLTELTQKLVKFVDMKDFRRKLEEVDKMELELRELHNRFDELNNLIFMGVEKLPQ